MSDKFRRILFVHEKKRIRNIDIKKSLYDYPGTICQDVNSSRKDVAFDTPH